MNGGLLVLSFSTNQYNEPSTGVHVNLMSLDVGFVITMYTEPGKWNLLDTAELWWAGLVCSGKGVKNLKW